MKLSVQHIQCSDFSIYTNISTTRVVDTIDSTVSPLD